MTLPTITLLKDRERLRRRINRGACETQQTDRGRLQKTGLEHAPETLDSRPVVPASRRALPVLACSVRPAVSPMTRASTGASVP